MRTNEDLHIIDFKTQSIVATFQAQDYWDDMREWELKNNVDILEFKVFDGTRQSISLQQQNLVLRQDREGNVIPYTIEDEVEKTAKDRSITVRAVGSWTGLRKAGFIRPQKLEGLTAHQYVSLATAGTKWQPGNIAYASFRTMTLDEFTDPLTLLKKVSTLFNLELNYRVEVDGNRITGWFVDLVEKVGRVTRKEIELGKDLINVTRIEHTKNICTALLGFARGEDNEVITIEKINNGSPYIVDNEAFQRWSENGQHKYGFYQPETEGEIDAKRLMTLMKTEMEKRKNSSVGYEVDALDIAEVFGLRHELIMKGDTIGIKDTAFTPALYLEARAIGGKESNTNPDRNKYTFGEYHEIVDYDAEMRRMYNRVQGLLENKAGKPMLDQLNKLVQEQEKKMNEVVETNQRVTEITEKLEEMVTNNSVTIHDGPNAPTEGLKEGKSLWLDTSNGKPGILKIWRGGKWEDVTEDFSGLEKEIRDQVAKDVDEKTKQLNKSISDMEVRAGEVEKKAEALETKANKLNEEITGIKGNVQSLDQITKEIKETERGTLETIKQLKVDGEKVDQTIVQIGKSLDGFNQSISQIKKDAETTSKTIAQQQQTINGFGQSIQKLETTDKTINETLVKHQQSLNGFTNEISQLKKKDGEIDQTLVKQQQTLNGFTNEISALKKTDGELKEITVKQEQTIKGISNSITEVNKNISGQSQKINTLESTANGNKQLIQNVQKDLTATKNDFKTTTTEIKEEAGKISKRLESVESSEFKVKNYIVNGSFENNLSNWSGITNNTNFKLVDVKIPGVPEIKKGLWMNSNNAFVTQVFDATGWTNEKGVVSGYIKVDKWTPGTDKEGPRVYARFAYDNKGAVVYRYAIKRLDKTGGWERVSELFDTKHPNGFPLTEMRITFATQSAGATVEATFSGLMVSKGEVLHPFNTNDSDSVGVGDFTKKTNEIIDDVNGTKQRVTNTEKDQNTFKTQITEINKRASGIETNVKNLTDLTTKHGQQITSSETKIKQLSDEVSAKMTSKQVEDYVAGVGMTNILRNAGLKTGMKTLYFGLATGTTATNSQFRSFNTFWTVNTGRTTDVWQGATSNRYPCQANEDFVASCWFVTDNVASIDNGAYMEVEQFNSAGTRIKTDRIKLSVSTAWQRAVMAVKTVANAVNITWRYYVQKNGRLRVGLPMLQRGKVASEFQLNPADVAEVDDLREDIARRIATEQYNQKITQIEREIKANTEGINLKATATEVYTKKQADGTFAKDSHVKTLEGKIAVNEKNISLSVKENNIIAKINVTKETILLDAKRINLVGAITAQHFQANTIKGVKYESHNPKDATNRVVIENSVIKSFGPLDKARNVQNYAELKEGGLHVYEVAPNGSPYGGKHVEALPGRLNVTSDRWSSAIEPSEFRIWAPDNLLTIALGEVPLATDGYGMRLTAPEGIMVQATRGSTRPTIQFNPPEAIYFDGYGNIVGGKYAKDWSTWSIKDAQGRLKYITGVGVGSAQTTEYSSYGGGHAFNHNGTRLCAMWIQGANWIQQFGQHAIFKWQNSAKRFEFRTGNDGGWVNASAGSFQNASSLVWKRDIKNFEGSALELILGTDIMTYRYKNVELEPFVDVEGNVIESDQENGEAFGPVRLGVISEFAPKLIANEDGSAVDLYAMISLGWKGIQENHKAIQDKDKRLNDQETRIKDQEVTIKNQSDRISNLETKLNQVLELLGKE